MKSQFRIVNLFFTNHLRIRCQGHEYQEQEEHFGIIIIWYF